MFRVSAMPTGDCPLVMGSAERVFTVGTLVQFARLTRVNGAGTRQGGQSRVVSGEWSSPSAQ